MYHNERDIVAVPFETREAMRCPLFELFLVCYGQRRYFSMPGARKNIQVSYNHIILNHTILVYIRGQVVTFVRMKDVEGIVLLC